MTGQTSNPLLMGCSLDALRRKLTEPASPLAPWWRHFLTMARTDPKTYSAYTVLAALVTGEPQDRERARQALLGLVELKEHAGVSQEAQFHTHVVAAPLGRWAVFYDWLADFDILSESEDRSVREALLEVAFTYPLQQLQSRILRFDNQVLASAFGVAAVGYVLGERRGDSAMARRLFDVGITWVEQLMGRLPEGGYGGEGSTYQQQVVVPLVVLCSKLLEESLGRDPFTAGLPPCHQPVRELLDLSYRMIGPAGLMPAWDHYGFEAAAIKCGLVFLAGRTADPQPLAMVREQGMWSRITLPAWELDDRLWSLVWWPENVDDPGTSVSYEPWMVPEAGGALQDPERKLRLFQYWDECGGAPHSGRQQVDPNAITLEAWGSPLLLDGRGCPGPEVLSRPAEAITDYMGRRTIETLREYSASSFGSAPSIEAATASAVDGCVGMANALVLDGEGWYVPMSPCRGEGLALHQVGPLQVIESDAAAYYTDRYDVTEVRRTSVVVRGRYAVVSDRVRARSPHSVTWQAYVRERAEIGEARIVVNTPDAVRLDLVPLSRGRLELDRIDGYPQVPDNRSARVTLSMAAAEQVRLDVALVPQSCLTLVANLTDGWQREIAGQVDSVSLADAWLTDPGTEPKSPRIYRRTFEWRSEPGKRVFLGVHAAARGIEVRINGAAVPPVAEDAIGTWPESTAHLPWLFDLTDVIRPGENVLEIAAPYFHGESVSGPVRLLIERAPEPVEAIREAVAAVRVTVGSESDHLLVANEAGLIAWAGGETDARHALLAADGTVAAIGVTRLLLPGGIEAKSQMPCDLVLHPDGTRHVVAAAGTEVECPVVINGTPSGSTRADRPEAIPRELRPSAVTPPQKLAAVYTVAEQGGQEAAALLIEALSHDDWRLQVAAADAAGELGLAGAVPVLLVLFAAAEQELPYPPLTKRLSWSKMLHQPGLGHGPETASTLAVKRWRLKRAIVTALGKIGDPRAVEPLEAALARCDDFFTVTSQLGVALGRLGSKTSIPVLERHLHHCEINTRVHARLAHDLLTGRIDRAEFEARVGASEVSFKVSACPP